MEISSKQYETKITTKPTMTKQTNKQMEVTDSPRHLLPQGYVDQLVFAPFNISQFFLGMSLLEGKAVDESICEWQDKMLPTWLVSWQALRFRILVFFFWGFATRYI